MSTRNENKHCKDCGKKGVKERYRCEECAKEYNRQREKARRKKNGRHNYGKSTCSICKGEMILWRKNQVAHRSCLWKSSSGKSLKKNDPDAQKGRYEARKLVNELLENTVPIGYEIHHIDENPTNNSLDNLVLLSGRVHKQLHAYLKCQRSLFLKENSSHDENCWNTLRVRLTTEYLETESSNVIKISEIGQSAAEPLSSKEYEEGSEAMHVGSK